jgi:hypothetical protein
MRRLLLLFVVLSVSALLPGVAPAARSSAAWSDQANQVCVVWVAKAKKEFATPVTASGLYAFAGKAKALEAAELSVLEKIPGRSASGTKALVAMRADIAEVDSAIKAWDRGDKATFVKVLKAYLNDHRAKVAFAAAGAKQCG